MENSNSRSHKIFLGFGVITIICGIALAFENPLIGISGSIVGVWLTVDNWKKIRSKSS